MNRNLIYLTRSHQSNRETIVRSLVTILQEGHNFNVYRFDIASFYESVNMNEIYQSMTKDGNLSRSTLRVFSAFRREAVARGMSGLPRGIALSATLSELYLRNFDKSIESISNCYFYARYVDDIIVVTTGEEDPANLIKSIRGALPEGLRLNYSKTSVSTFRAPPTKSPAIEGRVDFLGYRFSIHGIKTQNGKQTRQVLLDIAPKKVIRFKTRVCKSLFRFGADSDFDALQTRIEALTGNYNLYDEDKGLTRNVGIYFNYRFINHDVSDALPAMDSFLRFCLISSRSPTHAASIMLTNEQRRALLRKLPGHAFVNRTFYHIPKDALQEAVGLWKHD